MSQLNIILNIIYSQLNELQVVVWRDDWKISINGRRI